MMVDDKWLMKVNEKYEHRNGRAQAGQMNTEYWETDRWFSRKMHTQRKKLQNLSAMYGTAAIRDTSAMLDTPAMKTPVERLFMV